MDIRTEQSEASKSRTVELVRYDSQILGASIFLSASELRAVGVDIDCADRLLCEIVDNPPESIIKISGQTGSEVKDSNSSLTD